MQHDHAGAFLFSGLEPDQLGIGVRIPQVADQNRSYKSHISGNQNFHCDLICACYGRIYFRATLTSGLDVVVHFNIGMTTP